MLLSNTLVSLSWWSRDRCKPRTTGNYCIIGDKDGKPLTMLQAVKDIGSQAQAILSVGTCSAFGGLPAADPNPSGSKAVSEVIKGKPIINIAGCPPHPDW